MAEQTPDVEALTEVIESGWEDEPTPAESELADTVARDILASDWLAAREQAAERRGAAKALRQAAGTIKNNGSLGEAKYRSHPLSDPFGTVTAAGGQSVLFSGWYKENGSRGTETAPHPLTDPIGSFISRNNTTLLTAELAAEWRQALAELPLEECYLRMLGSHEIGRGCGFDVDFVDHKGTFIVWGSERDRVDGYGNAVSPPVGEWISDRLRRAVHSEAAA